MRVCPFGAYDWVCNDTERCFTCADVEHTELHPKGDNPDCRTCKLQSIQLNPRTCSPSTVNQVAPAGSLNSWEKGVATDHRGIPYRDAATGAPIPVKRFSEKRAKYEESIRRNHALA